MISFKNLARTFRMFTFEDGHTSSFAASIIIAIQNTLAESFAGLIETSIHVIIIRVALKYKMIIIIDVSDLHCRSKLGCHILGSHQCNQYDMDKLKMELLELKNFGSLLTVSTGTPSAITFHETVSGATGRDTL